MNLGKFLSNTYKANLAAAKSGTSEIPQAACGFIFIVTNRCNFCCKHCLRDLKVFDDLPLSIAEKALKGGKKYGYRLTALTGGEPFLYPHLSQLLELIARYGYTFNIATNGFLFEKNVDLLNAHRKNLAHISFSLESVDAKKNDSIRHEGSFAKLLEDFRICRELHIPFRIINATAPTEAGALFEVALFAKRKGAQALILATPLPCPRTEDNSFILDPAKRQALFETVKEISRRLNFPVQVTGAIRTNNNIRMCLSMNMADISIDARGNIVQCCDLANLESHSISESAKITSLADKTFEEALKETSAYFHKVASNRIDDFQKEKDPRNIDFNSCFYCIHKLKDPRKAHDA